MKTQQIRLRPLTLEERSTYYWTNDASRIVVVRTGWTLVLTGWSLYAEKPGKAGLGKRFPDSAEALATARYLVAHPEDISTHLS